MNSAGNIGRRISAPARSVVRPAPHRAGRAPPLRRSLRPDCPQQGAIWAIYQYVKAARCGRGGDPRRPWLARGQAFGHRRVHRVPPLPPCLSGADERAVLSFRYFRSWQADSLPSARSLLLGCAIRLSSVSSSFTTPSPMQPRRCRKVSVLPTVRPVLDGSGYLLRDIAVPARRVQMNGAFGANRPSARRRSEYAKGPASRVFQLSENV
jgi:hypothetical protein